MSVFWNKNDTTRQLLYGSSIIEIPSSGSSVLSMGGSRLFTVNNDIDCLGDMFLEVSGAFPNYTPIVPTNATWSVNAATSFTPAPFALQSLVERVEIQVGTQIWQTIENKDLKVVNSTELTPDSFSESSKLSTPSATGKTATAWLVIPSLTKTLGPSFGKFTNQTEDGYPMAAAPHQSLKIKVVFRDEYPQQLNYVAIKTTTDSANISAFDVLQVAEDVPFLPASTVNIPSGQSIVSTGPLTSSTTPPAYAAGTKGIMGCKLYAKQQIMCNEEREQMKSTPMGLPKRLKMTQNSYTTDIGSAQQKVIDLDHFSLFASHIIITGNVGYGIRLLSAELKLNSSSYSGVLPGVLLDAATSDSIGLYANKYIYQSGRDFKVFEDGMGTYVFPLAATAFSGSCVPLNRFDSIRLTLKFTSQPSAANNSYINVTCVGETTALFKGGAASLAMY